VHVNFFSESIKLLVVIYIGWDLFWPKPGRISFKCNIFLTNPQTLFFFNLFVCLFIYSHVHTLFGSFLHPQTLFKSVFFREWAVGTEDRIQDWASALSLSYIPSPTAGFYAVFQFSASVDQHDIMKQIFCAYKSTETSQRYKRFHGFVKS
jgi:hypothetical protein